MSRMSRIAVIGAGIAGLSCATLLKGAGHKVRVFEKSRGPSGRMSTRRGDDWQGDHGAQYFTARNPDFRAEIERWQQAGAAALWTPRLQVIGKPGGREVDPHTERFVGTPQMTSPARLLAASLDLQTQTTIGSLQREASGWRLASVEEGLLDGHFDAVVLALPAPQAGPLALAVAPALAALAESATMRGCWVLMLRFEAPLALPFDAAFVNHGPLRWIARDNSKPGRGGQECWVLHASAEWSQVHIEQDAASATRRLMQAFAELGGPAAREVSAHRWRYADTSPALDRGASWLASKRIGLCGDWLNGGRVEGAWLSGRALAEQILDTLSHPTPGSRVVAG